jgi:hypothetical protein
MRAFDDWHQVRRDRHVTDTSITFRGADDRLAVDVRHSPPHSDPSALHVDGA